MGSDEKPRERRNPIGPTARTVGANVRRLRQEIGDTQGALADRLKGNGHPIPVASIGRIESGDRRVEVDDLMALSVALGVSPLALLMPYTRASSDDVSLTGWRKTTALDSWRWALAGAPLAWSEGGRHEEESLYLTVRRSFPWWLDPREPTEGSGAPRLIWEALQGGSDGSSNAFTPGLLFTDGVDDGEHQAEA